MATPGDAGIVEIGHVDSHARAGFSFAAEREPGLHRGIFECAVVLVAIKLVGLSVIGHEQVGPAIGIVVEQCHSQRFGTAVEDSTRRRDIFERAVAAIMKEPASGSAIRFGGAVRFVLTVEAAEHVVLRRPLHVVADKEIEQAIAVVVEPQRGRAESFALPQSAGVGHIDERAFAGVAEQAVLSDAGDQNVREAVVVVIANRDAHAVHFDIETGAGRHVGECAIAIVVIEVQRGAALLVARPVGAVDQQNVLPAIAIVVQERAPGTEGFGQEFARRMLRCCAGSEFPPGRSHR